MWKSLRRLVGERGVLDVPRLERGHHHADQRAHAVDALGLAHVERHGLPLALRADRGETGDQGGHEHGCGQDAAVNGAQASPLPVLDQLRQAGLSHGVHIRVQLRNRSSRR